MGEGGMHYAVMRLSARTVKLTACTLNALMGVCILVGLVVSYARSDHVVHWLLRTGNPTRILPGI